MRRPSCRLASVVCEETHISQPKPGCGGGEALWCTSIANCTLALLALLALPAQSGSWPLPAASSLTKLTPQRFSATAAAATTCQLSSYSLRPGACAPWSNAPVRVIPCPTPRYSSVIAVSLTGQGKLSVDADGTDRGGRVGIGRVALGDRDHDHVQQRSRSGGEDERKDKVVVGSRGELLDSGLTVDAQQGVAGAALGRERVNARRKGDADLAAVPFQRHDRRKHARREKVV